MTVVEAGTGSSIFSQPQDTGSAHLDIVNYGNTAADPIYLNLESILLWQLRLRIACGRTVHIQKLVTETTRPAFDVPPRCLPEFAVPFR